MGSVHWRVKKKNAFVAFIESSKLDRLQEEQVDGVERNAQLLEPFLFLLRKQITPVYLVQFYQLTISK